MNYAVAVSGGVDSVVLLDMLVYKKLTIQQNDQSRGLTFGNGEEADKDRLIVAHFDHGIRPDSAADARFVAGLAKYYGLPCEIKREELGPDTSEAQARERRYAFLREVAVRHNATLVTAHHLDDVVETIAINLVRGTGWRGLAALGDTLIERPLLTYTKAELYEYALAAKLEWVEDESNQTDIYLRNRLRRKLRLSSETKRELLTLRSSQLTLASTIDREVTYLLTLDGHAASRYFFTMVDDTVAMELLRQLTKGRLTRPRLSTLLHGIKTAQLGSRLQLGEGVTVNFTKREFIVKSTP